MNPRNTALLALVVAALGAFVWFYEIAGEGQRREAEEAQKRVYPGLEADQIESIELRTSDGEMARLERSEGAWRLTQPISFEADAFAADGVASALAELSSEAVFEQPEPLAAYGLEGEPAVRFGVGDASYELRIGDKTPIGGNTYLATGDPGRVFAVASYRVNPLRKSVKDLREARVLLFDRDAVTGFRASWPGGAVHAVKEGDDWQLEEPLAARADADSVEDLLSTLQFLRADDFADEIPSDAEAGLEEPAFRVELETQDAEGPLRVEIGSRVLDGQRLVRGRAEQALYRIGEQRLEDFPRAVTAYRFKELSRFEVAEAKRFELGFEGAGQSLVVTGERGESGWTVSPDEMAAGKASRLVSELSSLKAHDIAAEAMGDEELAGLHLSPPRVRMRVFGEAAEGAEAPVLADVILGSAEPDRGVAAQRVGEDPVYWIDFELAEHLPVSLEAFQNRFVTSEEPSEPEASTGAEAVAP